MHTHFLKNFPIGNRLLQKKVTAVRRYAIFPLFTYANLGGTFSHFGLKTWLNLVDLAEFLIFFTKKVPGNIAAYRLKIGRT